MKKVKSFFSIFLSLLLVAVMMPYAEQTASADAVENYSLNGNSGATITFGSDVTSAVVDDSSLADVAASGNTVTVTAKDGAVGVASVTINGSETVEVPVGYTTFVFNEDALTVYTGNDDKYEVYGIKADSADDQAVTPSTDENGNAVYQEESVKLNVNIKKKGGTYVFSGKGNDMSITVNKAASNDANLLLASLDLTSSMTAPITVKKESGAKVTINALAGTTNTLTDSDFNNADTYGDTAEGGDGTNVEYAESAVIKCKSESNVTLTGSGTLNLKCNTKNAIKSGESGNLTIENLNLNVVSAKNGISADNVLTINSGVINVDSNNGDAIRSDPDTVNADAGRSGIININGGMINIKSALDGIQSAQDINITGGTFYIITGSGYNDKSFDKDTMSCKGIKASCIDDEEENPTNTISITGGTFNLNTADDAVHSDGYVVITKGQLEILTGDDGIHADTSLTLGTENGDYGNVVVNVNNSYEGLEAGNLYIYSGTYNVIASDDGINAAGGSDGSDDHGGFNPGGGPGRPGHGGGVPGMPNDWDTGNGGNGGNGNADYSLNIYGGNVYVNCEGDGLDSNGALNLEGGNVIVWSQEAGRDNSPLDSDGALLIKGATVFAAGGNSMNEIKPSSDSQKYVTSTTNYTKGTTINVTDSTNTVYSTEALKRVNFVLYSSPDTTASYKITSGSTTPQTFTVDFNSNGHGTAPAAQTINLGGFVTKPEMSDIDGYTFGGWYTEAACKNAYDFSKAVNSSFTLYAKWTKNTNPITKTYKIGDVNSDSYINSADALFVLRASVGLEEVDDTLKALSDVDGNDKITSADSLDILRYSVNLSVKSKVGTEIEM